MSTQTAHRDTYVRDHLPRKEDLPPIDLSSLPELAAKTHLNCATELLDARIAAGDGDRPALWHDGRSISYAQLRERADRIARVLVEDLGVLTGNRVLLRGTNAPTMVAAWLAVARAGGIVVATMPLLRARELAYVLDKARVSVALCDAGLREELDGALQRIGGKTPAGPVRAVFFASSAEAATDPNGIGGELGKMASSKSGGFEPVRTAAEDPVLIAFTSGTTGQPKGAVHTHRDLIAACECWPKDVVRPTRDDVFAGSPPLAFTYGCGGLLVFPFYVGASAVLVERPTPQSMLEAIAKYRVTILSSSPTMYRTLVDQVGQYDISSLQKCISAGEPLPLPTYQAWERATGLRIIDGIGSTEMFHIFISSSGDEIRPGSTGKVVHGYQARVVDERGEPVPTGTIGRLAVRGVTGCKYLDDAERQRTYVQRGWNMTGDAYRVDEDGYFWFQARADDLIISAGYNISGIEVENVLLENARVKECAVVGVPDEARGHIVKAFIVLRDPAQATPATIEDLQNFVKAEIAPYKYPRAIEFVEALPRTETGKLQRYKLREGAKAAAVS